MKLSSYLQSRNWSSICLCTLFSYAIVFLIDYVFTKRIPTDILSVLRSLVGCFLFSLFMVPKRTDHL